MNAMYLLMHKFLKFDLNLLRFYYFLYILVVILQNITHNMVFKW